MRKIIRKEIIVTFVRDIYILIGEENVLDHLTGTYCGAAHESAV